MSDFAYWYLNQLATYGIATVIAAQTGLLLAIWCTAWITVDHITARQRAHHSADQPGEEKP